MKAELLQRSIRDGRSVVEYQIQTGEMMDGLVLKQCKEGQLLGVLPMGAIYENGHNFMYAYTDKMETLEERLQDTVTQEMILRSFESIVHTLTDMEEQGINLAYAILDTRYIYMEDTVKKARLICMPGKNALLESGQLADFFRGILANAVYLNSEDGDYVAKLLSAINKEFELTSFLRLIHGLMMDARLDIVEETVPEPETPVVEPVAEEAVPEAEAPAVEPVVVETVTPEAPVVETVIPETPVVEPEVAEIVTPEAPVVEAVIPETPTVEPVVAEVVTPEAPVVEAVMPETPTVEPVVAEAVTPETPVAEPVVADTVVPTAPVTSIIPEDDIEFEPIPDELNAKIKRMNAQTRQTPPVNQAEISGMQQAPNMQPGPMPQMGPTSMSGSVPQPGMMPMPGMNPQPGMMPMPGSVPQPGAAPMPGMNLQPGMSPRPQIMPQDATYQQAQKTPNPHLIRVKTGEHISLPEKDFVMGKSQDGVDYVIADNTAISRIHCTIMKKNGVYYVRDEKSTNSTYVNGEQVLPGTEKLLLNNCKLVLGDEEFVYTLW